MPRTTSAGHANATGYIHFSDNTAFRRYVRLPGSVDEPLLMINYNPNNGNEESRVWAHANRIGSVVATTDENGGDVERYKYSPYGVSGDEGGTKFLLLICRYSPSGCFLLVEDDYQNHA